MISKKDVSFFDVYKNINETISFNISKDNFYLFFTAMDNLGDYYIDETIYYPEVYFKDTDAETVIETIKCDMANIDSKYQSQIDESELENFYCLNLLNYTLKSYSNSFSIKLYPCKNTSDNNYHCKSKELIDDYINGNDFKIKFFDLIITPDDFSSETKN